MNARAAGRACALLLACIVPSLAACDSASPAQTGVQARGPSIAFRFDSLDSRAVASEAFRGKPLVLAFVTSWDLASQAQTRILTELARRYSKDVAFVLVALEESKNRELVEAYTKALDVTFPVAMADPVSTLGQEPFGDLRVPAVFVFDAEGRVAMRNLGLTGKNQIVTALVAIGGPTGPFEASKK